MIDILFPKLHKEGYRFVAIAAVATFILLLISTFFGLISLIITIWIYFFFRDPARNPINDENYLVSPADGIITQVIETNGPKELGLQDKSFIRVSIFMNVFNCHVNRFSSSGFIEQIFYKPGKYINASLDKASEENERNYYKINCSKSGEEIIIVQIAGLIARRIVCEVEQGQSVKQGDRIGMIRFGSRVDIYFKNKKILAKVGQNVVAGESLIASE